MYMPEVVFARTIEEFKASLPEIGRAGLVGAHLEVESIAIDDPSSTFYVASIAVASAYNDQLSRLARMQRKPYRWQSIGVTGLHVDSHGGKTPEVTLWAHEFGQSTWRIRPTVSLSAGGISEELSEYEITDERGSTILADSGHALLDPTKTDDFITIEFEKPAIFAFASGFNPNLGVNPAMHQVETTSKDRLAYGVNRLTFARFGIQ